MADSVSPKNNKAAVSFKKKPTINICNFEKRRSIMKKQTNLDIP